MQKQNITHVILARYLNKDFNQQPNPFSPAGRYNSNNNPAAFNIILNENKYEHTNHNVKISDQKQEYLTNPVFFDNLLGVREFIVQNSVVSGNKIPAINNDISIEIIIDVSSVDKEKLDEVLKQHTIEFLVSKYEKDPTIVLNHSWILIPVEDVIKVI